MQPQFLRFHLSNRPQPNNILLSHKCGRNATITEQLAVTVVVVFTSSIEKEEKEKI